MCADIPLAHLCVLGDLGVGTEGTDTNEQNANAFLTVTFVSDPGVLCLLPASVKK